MPNEDKTKQYKSVKDSYPEGEEYSMVFWRTSQYTSYEEAERQGGTYRGEDCYGYSAFVDAMSCALAAAECLDGDADKDLRVRVTIDGQDMGDMKLSEAR